MLFEIKKLDLLKLYNKFLEQVLDIYIKLIIAIISFIAPLIIHLLSMFSDGAAHVRKKSSTELNQVNQLLKEQINDNSKEHEIQNIIKNSNKFYDERSKKLKFRQCILDPKRQIKKVFPTLFASLIVIALYKPCEQNLWGGNYNYIILLLIFLISLALVVSGVVFLKNIVWVVIDIKEELASEKENLTESKVEKAKLKNDSNK